MHFTYIYFISAFFKYLVSFCHFDDLKNENTFKLCQLCNYSLNFPCNNALITFLLIGPCPELCGGQGVAPLWKGMIQYIVFTVDLYPAYPKIHHDIPWKAFSYYVDYAGRKVPFLCTVISHPTRETGQHGSMWCTIVPTSAHYHVSPPSFWN